MQSFLSSLSKELEMCTHVTVSYEALNILIYVESSINLTDQFIALDFF